MKRKPSVIIIECNARRLESQHLNLGDEIQRLCTFAVPTAEIHLVKATTISELCNGLGKVAAAGVDQVVIVGHSNETGLNLADGTFVRWESLPEWLGPLRPRILVLMACRAVQWPQCKLLFQALPTLKEIFGSPVLTPV